MEEACQRDLLSRGTEGSSERYRPTILTVIALLANRAVAAIAILVMLTTLEAGIPGGEMREAIGGDAAQACCHDIEPQLHWYNVESAPQWICGCEPKYVAPSGLHLVHLEPGATTTVLIPPHGMVRVVRPDCEIDPADIGIWVSNGSGLYRLHHPGISEAGHSLVAAPDLPHSAVARIVRPNHHDCGLDVAVFTSHREFPSDENPFHDSICDWGDRIKLHRHRDKHVELFSQLSAGSWRPLDATGQSQLVLETRLHYPAHETQRHQAYQILLRYDGVPARVVDFQTTPETRDRYLVEGCDVVVGRRQTEYVCIPPGVKKVEINSTATVFVRARRLSPCNYHAGLNQLRVCGPNCCGASFPWGSRRSLWDLTPADVNPFMTREAPTCPTALLRRVARDNAYRWGGLTSLNLARGQVARSGGHPRWQALASDLKGVHTGYRNLLPTHTGQSRSERFAWFYTRRPREPGRAVSQHVVAEQHVHDLLSRNLSAGFFLPLPGAAQEHLLFHLPHERRSSTVRLAVDRQRVKHASTIMLQFDNREPIPLLVECQPDLVADQYEPSLGETGLTALNGIHGHVDAGTLGGPFGQAKTPAVCLPAATIEVLVPAGVTEVRLWSDDEHPPTAVALQYRKSNHFQLSERAYLELARREHLGSREFWHRMSSPLDAVEASFAARELRNHWVPMMRLLRSHERNFLSSVSAPSSSAGPALSQVGLASFEPPLPLGADVGTSSQPMILPHPRAAEILDRARQLASQSRWVAAFEAWSEVLASPTDESVRREAVAGQTQALERLGEPHLLDNILRGRFLYDLSPAVRRAAYEQLRARYRRDRDVKGEESLAATAALRYNEPEVLLDLAAVLAENGRYDFALLVATALPDERKPHELIVRCAYHMRWWRLFDSALMQLPSAPQREFWQAHRCLHEGAYQVALQRFERAGPPGHEFAKHLRAGLGILPRLRDPNISVRANAVLEWERWQQAHPGTRLWRDDESLVRTSAGGALVYSIDRDLTDRYHLALPNQRLVAAVYGPAEVMISARPVHPRDRNDPADDWLNVHAAGQHYLFPINANRPSSALEIVGQPTRSAGREVTGTISLGPGRHELQVAGDRIELLVQFKVRRPEFQIPVLPTINRDTMEAALAGRLRVRVPRNLAKSNLAAHITQRGQSTTVHPFVSSTADSGWNPDQMLARVDESLAARIALRSPNRLDWYQPAIRKAAFSDANLGANERLAAVHKSGTWNEADDLLLNGQFALPGPLRQAYLLSRGRFAEAAGQTSKPDDPAAAMRQMAHLVRWAEEDSGQRDRCAVLARQLVIEHPQLAELRGMEARVASHLRWEPVAGVNRSAGVHIKKVQGWSPESPMARVRRQLMRNLQSNDHLLIGGDALVLQTKNVRPTVLQVELEPVTMEYLPRLPIAVSWQLDGKPARRIELNPFASADSLSIDVPSGEHRIEWWIEDALYGQYVRLQVHERRRSSTSDTEVLRPEFERRYHIATHEEPVELAVSGPVLLRVDELQDNVPTSRYISVKERDEVITLRPSEGAKQVLMRIARCVPDHRMRRLHAPALVVAPQPVPAPWFDPLGWEGSTGDVALATFHRDNVDILPLIAPDQPPVTVDHLDQRFLGGHEDGTWSVGLGYFSRRALEEINKVRAPDEFGQLFATHRLYDEDRSLYRRTDFLTRSRESSGPSAGFRHLGWLQSPDAPWRLHWSASGYTQRPIPRMIDVDRDTEWACDFRGRIQRRWNLAEDTYHLPTVWAFGRVLSLDENPYGAGRVDQDIFTRYKSQHRSGLLLSDLLVWQRYLDQKLWLQPVLFTNEDFNPGTPDHVSIRTGWSQALGRLNLEASYRYARFFADGDRPSDVDQHLLSADLLFDRWSRLGRRFEVAGRTRYDVSNGEVSANIVLTWNFDRGRQFRDFHPSELGFLNLRQQQAELWTSRTLLE